MPDSPRLPAVARDALHDIAQHLRRRPRETCRDHGADVLWRTTLARQIDAVADGKPSAKGPHR